eukprot:2994965-Rhodomonas_salina.1
MDPRFCPRCAPGTLGRRLLGGDTLRFFGGDSLPRCFGDPLRLRPGLGDSLRACVDLSLLCSVGSGEVGRAWQSKESSSCRAAAAVERGDASALEGP